MTYPSMPPNSSIADPEDLLRIPLDNKTFNRQMKEMRAYADQVVARIKARKGPQPVKPDELPSPKESDHPRTKKWRDYWQFPGGMGLNIPNNIKHQKALTRIISEVLKRQIEYLESHGYNADKQRAYLVYSEVQRPRWKKGICPFLNYRGISKNDAHGGREICLSCPLWDEENQSGSCVYDKYTKNRK